MKAFRYFLIMLFVFCIGCSQPPSPLTLNEAEQNLTKILQDEFHYKAVIKPSGKTLWVYLPGERELFNYKAGEDSDQQPKKKFSVEYLNGKFEDNNFIIDYDIIAATKPSQNNGLSSNYTESLNKEYHDTLTALMRTYLDAQTPPDFIGIIFADIKNGIEMTSIFCLNDFKQYQASAMPYEEYQLRNLSETKGGKNIIGDWEGRHVNWNEMTWPNFLTKQIVNRINFKYQKSDFTPEENPAKEIARIISQTAKYYRFTDFVFAKINDLRGNTTLTLKQWELFQLLNN